MNGTTANEIESEASMKSYSFLFWAYNTFWLLLSGYLLFLVTRLRRMERRIQRVEDAQRSDDS